MSKRTLDFWQPRSPVPLTDEDAREIEHNLMGFFQVLSEWASEGPPISEPVEEVPRQFRKPLRRRTKGVGRR